MIFVPKIEFIPASVWNRYWLFARAYLKQIPLDVLKIDKSFSDDISNLQDDRGIAATIIGRAYSGL
jgi:hypothetical protein